jgi:hypothetical protein
MTLKIERVSGKRRTRIRLCGEFRSEHLDQVKSEIERSEPRVALDSGRAGLSDTVCGGDPPGSQHPDRRGGDDHVTRSGRAHLGHGTGGRYHHRPRTPTRSVLAIAGSA